MVTVNKFKNLSMKLNKIQKKKSSAYFWAVWKITDVEKASN